MVPPDRLPPMCKIRLTDFWEHFNAEYADLERDAVQSLQNGSPGWTEFVKMCTVRQYRGVFCTTGLTKRKCLFSMKIT